MHLDNLTPEELYVLLTNIRNVFAYYKEDDYLVPDTALSKFLEHCSNKIGEAYFKTPRNTIKAFVDFLSVLEQNPDIKWEELLQGIKITKEESDSLSFNDESFNEGQNEPEKSEENDEDALVSFTL